MSTIDKDAAFTALNYPDFYWLPDQFSVLIPTVNSTWEGYGTSEPSSAQFAVLSAAQAASFRAALRVWDDLIEPDFTEVTDPGGGQLRVAFTDMTIVYGSSNVWGYAYLPGYRGNPSAQSGDLWISSLLAQASFEVGSFNYYALLHELGHALGLRHPFEGATALPRELTTLRYSVLSYQLPADSTVWSFRLGETGQFIASPTLVYPTTPMLLDVLTIGEKYGTDRATAAGDDIYSWSESSPLLETIVDVGGHDIIDLSGHLRGSIIDLEPGAYSSIALYSASQQVLDWSGLLPAATGLIQETFARRDAYEWRDNLAIAFETVIEDVIAGSGNDIIYGNGADNHLQGGAGGDILFGGLGDDHLQGGAGDDVLYGGSGNDLLDGGEGKDEARFEAFRSDVDHVLSGDGRLTITFHTGETDIARQVEALRFDDALLLIAYEEEAGLLVHGAYRMALAREPDEAGFLYWQGITAQNGLSAGQLVRIFASSNEFTNLTPALDDTAFIERLYRDGLGREPDMDGHLFWRAHLEAGILGRTELIERFLLAPEFDTLKANDYDVGLWLT